MLKPSEVAERLRCSIANVYELIKKKQLGAFRVGANDSGLRVSELHLQKFLEDREEHPGKDAGEFSPSSNPLKPVKLKHLR
jgi:excisionase family DNA binding protein